MEFLSKFNPVENYLVLENSAATLKEMLKLTMLDLLLKDVLQTQNIKTRADSRSPERILIYAKPSANYKAYESRDYEEVFLTVFRDHPEPILFKHLVKLAFDRAKNKAKIIKDILEQSEISAVFQKSKFFNKIKLNQTGWNIKSQIETELEQLKSALMDNPSLLQEINGNVFLLDEMKSNPSFPYYQAISKYFDHAMAAPRASGKSRFGNWGSDSLTG